ncbi:post-GPI attachment to proteins factor 4-like [Lytechinus variegatus]|uniref:post-GPI attachment to proteins factor 4-like n=1 Tax=Lytechinus variegatus TaxID=7654 RepID=UPI001BB1BF4C|nr:post-GPI attachment to proteins factor 4-like [Lytechinus variegatus]
MERSSTCICKFVCKPFVYCGAKFISLSRNRKLKRFLLATFTIYFLTFCIALPILCHDLPLTKYYRLWKGTSRQALINEAKEINSFNADNAQTHLDRMPKEATKQLYEESMRKQDLRYAIVVQTIPRNGRPSPRYLSQLMLALHDILRESGGITETALFICNTQRSAGEHKEAVDLSEYFPMVQTSLGPRVDRYEREKEDYLFCLQEAQKLSPKYVIVLQDDALPRADFYTVLDYVLKYRVETQIHQSELHLDQDEWLWLKLNFPDSLAKYERNYYFALEWVSVSLIGASIFVFMMRFILTLCWGINADEKAIGVLPCFLVGFVYFMLFTWLLGRPYVTLPLTLSKSFYSLGPGTSCCLPAVLYPQSQIPGIIGFLETVELDRTRPLDFALDDYRAQSKLRQFLISPNLFFHIGVVSALHSSTSNSRVAESFLFIVKTMKTPFSNWIPQD